MINFILKSLFLLIPILLAVAFFTLVERKLLASIQWRYGPNVVGPFGLLQPFADALKLLTKELITPSTSDSFLFRLAPFFALFLSLVAWTVMPVGHGQIFVSLNIGILYLLAISSLNIFSLILAGWSSNSKYAFLGALWATAQLISYELPVSFIILTICAISKSFDLSVIVNSQLDRWNIITHFPLFIIFLICILAETNRHPFDLPEAEAELVSGYNVEYSGIQFAFFFLAEYSSILLMSSLTVVLFLGGWGSFGLFTNILPNAIIFGSKVLLIVIFFITVWAIAPWYRYDQLMELGWKVLLPITLGWFFFIISLGISFGWFK